MVKHKDRKNNQIFPFSSIGTPPQDLKYKGEKNKLLLVITIDLESM